MSASPVYAIAYGLKGFRVTSLRVRIERQTAENVWVRTADLLDSGTPLCLSPSQIELEDEWEDDGPVMHKDGLVAIG